MIVEIKVPSVGESVTEAILGQWFKNDGDMVNKGDPLFVEGRLKFDSWQAQDGSKRSKLRVFVENFEFMGGGRSNSNQGGQSSGGSQQDEGMAEASAPFGPGGDDIPF